MMNMIANDVTNSGGKEALQKEAAIVVVIDGKSEVGDVKTGLKGVTKSLHSHGYSLS